MCVRVLDVAGWQRDTFQDRKWAESILRQYSEYLVLSLESTEGVDCELSSCCQKAAYDEDGSIINGQCHFVTKGIQPKCHPILLLNRAVYADERRYHCTTHQCNVDIWDDNFSLGATDRFCTQILDALNGTEPILYKFGDFQYSMEAFESLWGVFVNFKKQSVPREILLENWYRHYCHKLSDHGNEEQDNLAELMGVAGPKQAVRRLVELVFPSTDTVNRLIQDFGLEYGLPICQEHKITMMKKGSRVFIYDGTFRIYKSVQLAHNVTTKISAFNVMDEDVDWVLTKMLRCKTESFENLVPELAQCVWYSLTFGPYRAEPFIFGTDNAENQCKIIDLIFRVVIDDLNGGRDYINAHGKRYDLYDLMKISKVSYFVFNSLSLWDDEGEGALQ